MLASMQASMLYQKHNNTDNLTTNVELNPTSLYIYGKEKCPLLSLHDKPTQTLKVFNDDTKISTFHLHLLLLNQLLDVLHCSDWLFIRVV